MISHPWKEIISIQRLYFPEYPKTQTWTNTQANRHSQKECKETYIKILEKTSRSALSITVVVKFFMGKVIPIQPYYMADSQNYWTPKMELPRLSIITFATTFLGYIPNWYLIKLNHSHCVRYIVISQFSHSWTSPKWYNIHSHCEHLSQPYHTEQKNNHSYKLYIRYDINYTYLGSNWSYFFSANDPSVTMPKESKKHVHQISFNKPNFHQPHLSYPSTKTPTVGFLHSDNPSLRSNNPCQPADLTQHPKTLEFPTTGDLQIHEGMCELRHF